jgi:hypothetical protein
LFRIDPQPIHEEDAMKRLVWMAAVLSASTGLASAQTLAEVAKKEKERRKKVEAPAKQSFTETDLRGGPRIPPPRAGSSPEAGEAEAEEAETPAAEPEPDPTKTEAYWRDRVSAVNKRIQDLEARLQSPELNADTRGASRRQAAERDLAQAKSEKQAIAEEARRKGVPPGWVR